MKTVAIPGVPFAVSRICLGCAPYGSSIPASAAHKLMDYYFDRGGFFFNTAHEYGDGLSERCLGEWVTSRGVRDRVIITTKGETRDIARGVDQTLLLDKAFVNAVATGDPSGVRSPYGDALKSLELSLAANESMETGKVIYFK